MFSAINTLPRLLLLLALSLLASAPAQAEFTGEDWLDSSAEMKKGVVLGALTIIDAERAFEKADSTCDNAAPTLVRGLGHGKVPQLQQALDDYYRDHPEQRDRAIIHAIWAIALESAK